MSDECRSGFQKYLLRAIFCGCGICGLGPSSVIALFGAACSGSPRPQDSGVPLSLPEENDDDDDHDACAQTPTTSWHRDRRTNWPARALPTSATMSARVTGVIARCLQSTVPGAEGRPKTRICAETATPRPRRSIWAGSTHSRRTSSRIYSLCNEMS